MRERARQLGPRAPLLKEVGSFEPSNIDEGVFDLGGNVAEWTITAEGTGKVMGGSADAPADSKRTACVADPAYIGFRVVKAPTETAATK